MNSRAHRGGQDKSCRLTSALLVGAARSVSSGAPSDIKARSTASKGIGLGPFLPSSSATSNSFTPYSHRCKILVFYSREYLCLRRPLRVSEKTSLGNNHKPLPISSVEIGSMNTSHVLINFA
jgi:hypothetical protein